MRKIKFRGIYKEKPFFVYGSLINNAFVNSKDKTPINYIFNAIKDNFFDSWESMSEDHNIFEILPNTLGQFTGLKDKNGKEIYEGDILRWKATTGDNNNKIYHNQVYWLDYRYRIKGSKAGRTFHCDLNFNLIFNHEAMVIGNIHENKNLLN